MRTYPKVRGYFESNPNVLGGAKVIRGTRLTPSLVRQIAAWKLIQIYPYLTEEQIMACFRSRP